MSEYVRFVLLLPNTVYAEVCTSWPPPTSWDYVSSLVCTNTDSLQHGLLEFVLQSLLPNTPTRPPPTRWRVCQVCTTSTKYWPAFNMVKSMSEFVLLLPNTDRLQILHLALEAVKVKSMSEVCTTSTKYWQPPTWWSSMLELLTVLTSTSIW